MLRYTLSTYGALSIVFHSLIALGDLGPYFKSISYEHAGYGKWPYQSYQSSDSIGPVLNIHRFDDKCDNGQYIFLSPTGHEIRSSLPTILDGHGNLVWTSRYHGNWGLDVQMMDEQPYLTFCASRGLLVDPTCYMLTPEYEEAFAVKPRNGWTADGTEFQITQQKTAVLTTSMLIPYDLTPVNGPRQGLMRDVGFQEIDLETGALHFQWSWSDHWNITNCIHYPGGAEGSHEMPWDPFHINSVQKDSAGNYLVSSRHTNTVGYINGNTGEFIWKLGGKTNDFKDLSGGAATGISMQHHARFLEENSTLSLFDNGVIEGSESQTKGKIIDIDVHAMTAKVRQEYKSPHKIGSLSRGSMQVLDNGHALLGYGVNPGWSEFSKEGELLCDVHFGPESRFGSEDILSYRVFKRNWIGRPKTSPNVAYKGENLYISWNGATEIATWVLLPADADTDNFTPLVSVPKEGFETRLPVPKDLNKLSLRAAGLDSHGNILGSTPVLDLVEPFEHNAPPLVIQY